MRNYQRKVYRFCAIDCEGDASVDGFKGGSWYCETTHGFIQDHDAYIKQLHILASSGYTFVAHNAEYDISVVFWTKRLPVRIHYFNTSFNHAEWIYNDKHKPVHIWDSVKLSGGLSLAKLAKAIGLEKWATPKSLLTPVDSTADWFCDDHNTYQCVECYAVRDAEIVYRFMLAYQHLMSDFDCEPKRTPASAAVAIWRSIEKPKPILLPENEMADFARRAYVGGRVEPFELGECGQVSVGDVNSMYPFVMMLKPMPFPRTTNINRSVHLTERFIEYEGCTDVTVRMPYLKIPVLPVRINNKLMFPVGTFRGVFVNAELRAAIARGCEILKVHACVYSPDICYPYARFVASMNDLRVEHKRLGDPRELMDKRIMNSLYGRMGLAEVQTEEILLPMPDRSSSKDFPDYEIQTLDRYAMLKREIVRASVHRWANVLWAASITAYARLTLLEHLEAFSDRVVYCDTDSVFVKGGLTSTGNALGDLGHEGTWDNSRIIAPKLYMLWDESGGVKLRAKGVKERVAELYMRGERVSYDAPYRPREGHARGGTPGEWHIVSKQRRLDLGKRRQLTPDIDMFNGGHSTTEPYEAMYVPSTGTNVLLRDYVG